MSPQTPSRVVASCALPSSLSVTLSTVLVAPVSESEGQISLKALRGSTESRRRLVHSAWRSTERPGLIHSVTLAWLHTPSECPLSGPGPWAWQSDDWRSGARLGVHSGVASHHKHSRTQRDQDSASACCLTQALLW